MLPLPAAAQQPRNRLHYLARGILVAAAWLATSVGLADEPAPIPAELKPYLADYPVVGATPEARTVLRAGFLPAKPQLVWGEPLTLTFTVTNLGGAEFQFMFGGDNRGTGRHDRFKIEVKDAGGSEVPDPHANAPNFGGIATFETLEPGGPALTRQIDLLKFRSIPGPGRYTVTCRFAFDEAHANRGNTAAKPVVQATFPLTILARTPERVEKVLDELQGLVAKSPTKELPARMAAMARFGREDAVSRLATYATAGSSTQQVAAYAALALVESQAAFDVLVDGISHPEPRIRRAAASAMGNVKHADAVTVLIDALAHEQPAVQPAVLVALGTSRAPRALPVLAASLDSGPVESQRAAVDALSRFGGAAAVAVLQRHVESPDLALRYQVVQALVAKLRSPLDPEWLRPILMCRRHNHQEWLGSLSRVADKIREALGSDAAAEASGFSEPQLKALHELTLPPKYPETAEGLTLLYIWWQESPEGPVRARAREYLMERVREAVQRHHTDHVEYAAAVNEIITDGGQ